MRRFFLVMVALIPVVVQSQPDETGNWLMYFGLNRVSNNFSVHTEVQYRNHTAIPGNTEQLLLRTGLNYHFSSTAFVTAGYGYIGSNAFDGEERFPETAEHRIWQQFLMTNNIGPVKFEHRYRVEQRWIESDYRNRLRYRLMLFVPINKPQIEQGSVFIGLYDEIFLNTEQAFFDRNRLYGALGYQFTPSTGVQVGMLYQQISEYGKWYLQFALVFNPDFR